MKTITCKTTINAVSMVFASSKSLTATWAEVPASLHQLLGLAGLAKTLQNARAGIESPTDAEANVRRKWESLKRGEWITARQPSFIPPSRFELLQSVVSLRNVSESIARAALDKLSAEQVAALVANPAIIAQVKAMRADEAAREARTGLDLDALLAPAPAPATTTGTPNEPDELEFHTPEAVAKEVARQAKSQKRR